MKQIIKALDRVRRMIEKYAAQGTYRLHPDRDRVESIIQGLAGNLEEYGRAYCPCVPIEKCLETGRKYVCPCEPHHEDIARQGYCDCALFVSKEFFKSEAKD